MKGLTAIVSVDDDWAIGFDDKLLFREPKDLAHFRALTTGNVIIYGSKTLQTFPGKKPLPLRTNIIFSRDENFKVDGAIVVHSIEEFWEVKQRLEAQEPEREFFVIGGESIYNMFMPFLDECIVTRFFTRVSNKNHYFLNLENPQDAPNWEMIHVSELKSCTAPELEEIDFDFAIYKKIKFWEKKGKEEE